MNASWRPRRTSAGKTPGGGGASARMSLTYHAASGPKIAVARLRGSSRPVAQRRDLPAMRQRRVERRQIGQGDPGAAERDRQTRLGRRLRQAQPDAGSGERRR